MKISLPVFFAILAAATVIYFFLDYKKKFEQWETAKQTCVVHFELSKRAKEELSLVTAESRSAFVLKMEQRHRLEEEDEATTGTLISLLERKPRLFGSARAQLSKDEAELLEFHKFLRDRLQGQLAQIRVTEKKWAKAAAESVEAIDRVSEFDRLRKFFEK